MSHIQKLTHFYPIPKDLFLKITILKSMMYCGVLWGLYHEQGWAMMTDQDDFIFPFWLNSMQASKYAQQHWPNYRPKKITPKDFQTALLPTLTRLQVTPALFHAKSQKFKLTTAQMRHFFFSHEHMQYV